VYDRAVTGRHFTDTIDFREEGITDRELIVEFYNDRNELLKWESILILTTRDPIELPSIEISLNTTDLDKVQKLETQFTVRNAGVFTLDDNFRYVYVHHEGWAPGEHRSRSIDTDQQVYSFTDSYSFSDECIVMNVGAGVDIRHGKFVKRIYNQQLVYRGDWADAVRVDRQTVKVASEQ
jgi:hypothetical protein